MIFAFDNVPIPPRIDFKDVNLSDPSNFQAIMKLNDDRQEVIKAITELSSNQLLSNDATALNTFLASSFELVSSSA